MEFQLEHPKGLAPIVAVIMEGEVIATMRLPLDLTAAMLSNPTLVGFYREGHTTHVNTGTKYVDGTFVFPDTWKEIEGVPTPPEILAVSN